MDRFSFRPKRPETAPTVNEEGVVTGELGHVEPAESEPATDRAERLRPIENDLRKDAELAEALDAVAAEEPLARIEGLLDRINEMRRILQTRDVDPTFRRDRDLRLSEMANRLRELL